MSQRERESRKTSANCYYYYHSDSGCSSSSSRNIPLLKKTPTDFSENMPSRCSEIAMKWHAKEWSNRANFIPAVWHTLELSTNDWMPCSLQTGRLSTRQCRRAYRERAGKASRSEEKENLESAGSSHRRQQRRQMWMASSCGPTRLPSTWNEANSWVEGSLRSYACWAVRCNGNLTTPFCLLCMAKPQMFFFVYFSKTIKEINWSWSTNLTKKTTILLNNTSF